MNKELMTKTELEPVPNEHAVTEFSLCQIKNRYIMLSGGFWQAKKRALVFVFDTRTGTWIPNRPQLN